jgi:excinuclease ABC subunit A
MTSNKNDFENLDPRKFILVKGARVHNLKDISVAIPRNKLVVLTGLSGSGKSSLAFDTIYAEGQRRYVESLSSYARQFLGRLNKPDVDYVKGISPAIAIEQKVNTRNPRSTVGTSTEIYDYLKLLFARAGKTYSPISGNRVKRSSVSDVVDFVFGHKSGTKIMLFAKIKLNNDFTLSDRLKVFLQQGFSRVKWNNEITRIDELISLLKKEKSSELILLIDRLAVEKDDEGAQNRFADSVQTAFYEGNNECVVEIIQTNGTSNEFKFSNRFELDGISFEEPTVNLFAFNNPYGACKRCEGYGSVIGIDEDLVVPNKKLSVYDGAIAPWNGPTMKEFKDKIVMNAYKFDFPVHRSYYDLTLEEKDLLWYGNRYFKGLNDFFKMLEEQTYKIQYRVMLSRYRGKTKCPDCRGTRLRPDANYVKIGDKCISDLVLMQIKELLPWFEALPVNLSNEDIEISSRLLVEITNRLRFLSDVGLSYLTLNRLSNTLSGGESQRINLATSLGSSLVGSLYVLDEPSIGLHPRDTLRLINVLTALRNVGNTVIVVEHDEEIMRAADQLIDIGPMAGSYGGNLVFQGNHDELLKENKSLTARYLNGDEHIPIPSFRRKTNNYIEVFGAKENNLKNIDLKIPLNCLTVITGVSGSGKTSLIKRIVYPALKKYKGGFSVDQTGNYDKIDGDMELFDDIEFVDQNPIGKSSRSNPITYIKAYDEIRSLFAHESLSKTRGYKPSHFSFNVDGGRCEICHGEGEIIVEMQFMADVHLGCEACNGKRFKQEVLEVLFEGKSIADVLDLTVDDAVDFFGKAEKQSNDARKLVNKLITLSDVGLGYVKLGQSSSTLSGGEAQRIKLAYFLTLGKSEKRSLFVFDEPTTGLHFHDIEKLINSINALINLGHHVWIIEHNPEIIKCADWVIDLGPDGGDEGGRIVFEGTPEELINCNASYTGIYLKNKLSRA